MVGNVGSIVYENLLNATQFVGNKVVPLICWRIGKTISLRLAGLVLNDNQDSSQIEIQIMIGTIELATTKLQCKKRNFYRGWEVEADLNCCSVSGNNISVCCNGQLCVAFKNDAGDTTYEGSMFNTGDLTILGVPPSQTIIFDGSINQEIKVNMKWINPSSYSHFICNTATISNGF